MTEMPLVSVLIPSFNHAKYITESIRSVQNQTYPNWEVVVVDDASSDDSFEIARSFDDPRITVLRNERNRGVNPTLARAFAVSTGDFINMLASDDALLPDKLERQVAVLSRSGSDVVYANALQLSEQGTRIKVDLSAFAQDFAQGSALHRAYTDDTSLPLLQSALFSRQAFGTLSEYRESVKLDDWITLIKALEQFRVEFLNEPLFVYRQHAGNTYRQYERTLGMRLEIIAKVVPPQYQTEALRKLFASQANYYARDGRYASGLRFAIASQGLGFSLRNATLFARAVRFSLRNPRRTDRLQ